MIVHIWPSPHWVNDEAYAAICAVAQQAESDVRALLPALHDELYLLVNQTDLVIPETGSGGYTIGPRCVRWDVDPARGVAAVARAHLRRTLFHECHHAVRLQQRPEEALVTDWRTIVVFEGLATVFEDDAGGERPAYRTYDADVVAAWAAEFIDAPIGDDWMQWKFEHPDGRRYVAYKVGAWIADNAIARSGRTAADLVWASPAEVIELAACLGR